MNITIGRYKFIVKDSFNGCHGCFYADEPVSVCHKVGGDIKHQLPAELFHADLGGCKFIDHVLIEDNQESILKYLIQKENGEYDEEDV